MELRQKWWVAASILLAGLLALLLLLSDRDPERSILKLWSAHYEDATEFLSFHADGRFTQSISYRHGGRFTATGSWRSEHNGDKWDLYWTTDWIHSTAAIAWS